MNRAHVSAFSEWSEIPPSLPSPPIFQMCVRLHIGHLNIYIQKVTHRNGGHEKM